MDSFVGVEVFTVKAKDAEAALAKAKSNSRRGAVVYVADDLSTLPHPGHLADVQDALGAKDVEDGG